MMITNRQKKKMNELLEAFSMANKTHGFDLKSINFYMDDEKECVIMKVEYSRTLVNVVDGKIEVHVIDKKGTMSPLSWNIANIEEQLKYLQNLKILN